MGVAAIRTQIKTVLNTVSGIGVIHEYERFVPDRQSTRWRHLFLKNGVINGWVITRTDGQIQQSWLTNREMLRTHPMVIIGFYDHDDAKQTEITFQNLVDSILDTFAPQMTLSSTSETAGPAQVRMIDHRIISGQLVHHVDISLPVQERLTITGIT